MSTMLVPTNRAHLRAHSSRALPVHTHRADEEHLLLSDIQDHRIVSVKLELCCPAAYGPPRRGVAFLYWRG